MLGFVRHLMPYRGLPIGVDLGDYAIRLAQVEMANEELRLIHADEIPIDAGLQGESRSQALVAAIRAAFRRGAFQGRQIAVGLPASAVQIKHLRMPRSTGVDFAHSLAEHATTALNAPAADFMIRGVVAGDVQGEQVSEQEVVLFATPRETIHQLLEDAATAKVDVVGVHVQQKITCEYFSRLYRRSADGTAVNLFIDLGASGMRACVASPWDIRFVRTMPISITQIHERIARQLGLALKDAAALRQSLVALQVAPSGNLSANENRLTPAQQRLADETTLAASKLAEELDMCRRYYDSTFPNQPVTRLIFVGGGARDRPLCAAIAQAMTLPAQIGDPLVRFNRSALPTLTCIDRREAMPQWSMAFGLSLCGQTVALV